MQITNTKRIQNIMADENAFVASNAGGTVLNHFGEQTILRLGVGPGTYVVFGRVVVQNDDGDGQNTGARITSHDGSNLIDSVSIRVPGGSANTVHLQGTLIVPPNRTDVVDIRCGTFKGFAKESSLFAIEVARLKFGP
jgi:hypothetical protein